MRGRLLTLGLALLWTAGATAASSAEDARALIKRMNDALINRNYYGELAHRWIGGAETLRLTHRMRDGKMVERVVSLNGSGYEVVRDGDEYIQYFPPAPGAKPGSKRIALVETRTRSYGYIAALNGVTAGSEKYYAISSGGAQALLGWPRPTQFVVVEPKDTSRYGYRLWLDPQSALPIKTQMVNKAGEVIDEISFTNLWPARTIPDDWLKPLNPDDFHWKRLTDQRSESVKHAFAAREELLPPGYRVRNISAPNETSGNGPKTRFIVSDGISWVSVVVTIAGKPQGKGGITEGFGPTMGASASYVMKSDGHYISVMGEVPSSAVKTIAEAFRPE